MVLLVVLLLAALVFGVGAVVKGLLWMFLIFLVLITVAGWCGYQGLRRRT